MYMAASNLLKSGIDSGFERVIARGVQQNVMFPNVKCCSQV